MGISKVKDQSVESEMLFFYKENYKTRWEDCIMWQAQSWGSLAAPFVPLMTTDTLVLNWASSSMNQPISTSVSAHSRVCLISGRPEECPQKYPGKSMFQTVCRTRRIVSLRVEASETCEGWFLRFYIKTHAWKGWKGTRFPSQQHRGELHQGLSPSSAPANREMDGFTQSWEKWDGKF